MKDQLAKLLQQTLETVFAKENLETDIPEIKLERTRDPSHGDFASNIALMLGKKCGMNPREFAKLVINNLPENSIVSKVDVAGPGFINFFLAQNSQMEVVKEVLIKGTTYGCNTLGHDKNGMPQSVQVEFVSANPTGPLHVGHGRGAAVGDSLCRVLSATGWDVTREFYYNDAGQQINNLTLSVKLRCKGITPENDDWPEDGYRGDYINDVAQAYLNKETVSDHTGNGDPDNDEAIREFAVAYLRNEQDLDLKAFDVNFDVFSLESALYTDGSVENVVSQLIERDFAYEEDGALWLRTTDFGDDKDRVMRKKDGGYTYFVPDVAYHKKKWERGFGKVINEQGADHHSTITRVRAGLQALGIGIPEGWPDYVLHQMVTVMKNGEEVKISKRAGSYVTLRDLIDQVGTDATRYFLVARRPDSQITFDIDLALQKNNENPVYYIQYAHARICSALENTKSKYSEWSKEEGLANLDKLTLEEEIAVAKIIASYPEKLAIASSELAPHTIAAYLRELASVLHSWYAIGNQDSSHQWLVDDSALRNARLSLATAAKHVLFNGLSLLGISAPNKM